MHSGYRLLRLCGIQVHSGSGTVPCVKAWEAVFRMDAVPKNRSPGYPFLPDGRNQTQVHSGYPLRRARRIQVHSGYVTVPRVKTQEAVFHMDAAQESRSPGYPSVFDRRSHTQVHSGYLLCAHPRIPRQLRCPTSSSPCTPSTRLVGLGPPASLVDRLRLPFVPVCPGPRSRCLAVKVSVGGFIQ